MGVVFGCVSMCQSVLVCVVFVVLLVAVDVLAVVWRKKKNDVCNFKKMSRERIYLHYDFNELEKIKNRIELRSLLFKSIRKTIKSAPRISVIIFGRMVAEDRIRILCPRDAAGAERTSPCQLICPPKEAMLCSIDLAAD